MCVVHSIDWCLVRARLYTCTHTRYHVSYELWFEYFGLVCLLIFCIVVSLEWTFLVIIISVSSCPWPSVVTMRTNDFSRVIWSTWWTFDFVCRHVCKIDYYWFPMMFVRGRVSHYSDVIMGTITSQITSLPIVYSTICLDADQRKHQGSASLALVRGITRKIFPFDDVILPEIILDLIIRLELSKLVVLS